MYELTDDIFYEYIKKYDELLLDYVLLSDDGEYYGEISHKKAVINAISVINSRKRIGNRYYKKSPEFYVDESKMICRKCSNENFFEITPQKIVSTEISYCDAFLYYIPCRIIYSEREFEKINHVLFPECFRKNLEIYQWNDAFSDYFNDGKDYLGASMWSIYDKNMCRFVIIGTSVTD